jgi:hypothetical protein
MDAVRGAHRLGGVDQRAGLDHHRLAVHARLRRHRRTEGRLVREDGVHVGDGLLEPRVVDGERVAVDDHGGRLRGEPTELLVDDVAGGERLAALHLPHRAGQRVLELRREHAEADHEQTPDDEHLAAMAVGPAPESGEWGVVDRFVDHRKAPSWQA